MLHIQVHKACRYVIACVKGNAQVRVRENAQSLLVQCLQNFKVKGLGPLCVSSACRLLDDSDGRAA